MKDSSNSTENYSSYEGDKKNDDNVPAPQAGYLWRFGSGIVNVTGGVMGAGVGAVKFVANTSYGAVSKTAEVGVSATKAVASTGYNVVSTGVSAVTSKIPVPAFSKGKDKKD